MAKTAGNKSLLVGGANEAIQESGSEGLLALQESVPGPKYIRNVGLPQRDHPLGPTLLAAVSLKDEPIVKATTVPCVELPTTCR